MVGGYRLVILNPELSAVFLVADEPPHIDSTLAVTVEEGQTVRLKCTAGEGIDVETLKFERELEEVHGKRSPRRFVPSPSAFIGDSRRSAHFQR